MQMKRWMPILLIVAIAAGGFVGFSAVGKVSAQSATPTATASALPTNSTTGQAVKNERAGITSEELAAALGITTDALAKAQTQAKSAALTKAVADGLITQAQADEITTEGAAFPLGNRWGQWLSAKGIDFDAFLADALGISEDALTAARSKALEAHLSALVAEGRLTQDQADLIEARQALAASTKFTGAMQSAFETAVAQAVKDGTITQTQADLLLAQVAENGGIGLGWGGMSGGAGMGGGRHGR